MDLRFTDFKRRKYGFSSPIPSQCCAYVRATLESNKHPNLERRGHGRGADSFVFQSYPVNNFVADCRNKFYWRNLGLISNLILVIYYCLRNYRGGHWEYPMPQYCKKNLQIPKYRVENRRNTDTALMIGHALKLYPSCVFVYLKHVYTKNQPQPL